MADWQTWVTLLIVAGALGVIGRRLWRARQPSASTGCGSACAGCPVEQQSQTGAPSTPPAFVAWDDVVQSATEPKLKQ